MFVQMEIAGVLTLRDRLDAEGEKVWELEFGNIAGVVQNVPAALTREEVCDIFHSVLDKAIILQSKGKGYEGLNKACLELARIVGRRPPERSKIAVYLRYDS